MFDFLFKGKNFDTEILKLLKQKISLELQMIKTLTFKYKIKVSLFYKDENDQKHLITSSEIDIEEP